MNLITNKDNNMNTKELILPDDWEVKEVVDNKIIIREKEMELPKTWEKCAIIVNDFELFNIDSEVVDFNLNDPTILLGKDDHRIVPKGLGEPMLALCQLLICRNAWWKRLGWEPDWENGVKKYCITCIGDEISNQSIYQNTSILAFPTPEVRDQFLDSFRDLIEEAKELL